MMLSTISKHTMNAITPCMLETLKVFLEHNSNVHQAAAHMHIHTNTLNYRLKRIKEIGNIDFKDMNQKTMLYLDLLIYENEQEDL